MAAALGRVIVEIPTSRWFTPSARFVKFRRHPANSSEARLRASSRSVHFVLTVLDLALGDWFS
jgi:hypothetical protein